MKSYTDIEQSKKLAEFLPLESADMYWWATSKRYYIEAMDDGDFNEREGHIRAWSLASLFSMLPKSAYLEKSSSTELCRLTLPIELISSDWNLEPVDACVEMIIKLHELKLL